MSFSSKVLILKPLMAVLLLDKSCNSAKFIAIFIFSLSLSIYIICVMQWKYNTSNNLDVKKIEAKKERKLNNER